MDFLSEETLTSNSSFALEIFGAIHSSIFLSVLFLQKENQVSSLIMEISFAIGLSLFLELQLDPTAGYWYRSCNRNTILNFLYLNTVFFPNSEAMCFTNIFTNVHIFENRNVCNFFSLWGNKGLPNFHVFKNKWFYVNIAGDSPTAVQFPPTVHSTLNSVSPLKIKLKSCP